MSAIEWAERVRRATLLYIIDHEVDLAFQRLFGDAWRSEVKLTLEREGR